MSGLFSKARRDKLHLPKPKVVIVSEPAGKPKSNNVSRRSSSSNNLRVATLSASQSRAMSPAAPTPKVVAKPSASRHSSASPLPSSSDETSRKRKKAAVVRRSPASADRVAFDSDSSSDDDDDDWEERLDARKRRRHHSEDPGRRTDPKRRLRHPALARISRGAGAGQGRDQENGNAAGELSEEPVHIVNAADVLSLKEPKARPIFPKAAEDELVVELQYPGSLTRERYVLAEGKDMINVIKDITTVVGNVVDFYLTEEEASAFENTIHQLNRFSNPRILDLKGFKKSLDEYNDCLLALIRDGTIAKNLDQKHELDPTLVAFILNQIYDRIVAPDVEVLKRYDNGTDNVYGEMNSPFSSMVLSDMLRMTQGQVFIDLGSGVGNVVLQAALEIGCESWGIEMMEGPCGLAAKQLKEFKARCQLWGIATGPVRLLSDDFTKNQDIKEVLQRADVILCNNQAYTSRLNNSIVAMLLDAKLGCKIVSLKSFVHESAYHTNDMASTILDVEHHTFPEGFVSWTNAHGKFCISTC